MSNGKKITVWVSCVVILALSIIGGWAYRTASEAIGSKEHPASFIATIRGMKQVASDPYAGFPGQDKINVLCMGIDDNWTNSDEVYTHNARTDTLFLLTLDLADKTASMLSIPRDTYTHIAGTNYSDKINSAYTTGGPERSIATVAELTGVHADHYVVLNIDATKKMVDALGGVDLTVEHPMRYDDNWGHLHVDLKPGFQHLDGAQAVGFARYRHPDPGMPPTPEDGDERRMYRQHVLLRAMVAKAKDFTNVAQMNNLIDIAMSTIHTDMTRTQLFDLASIYKDVQPDTIRTASLPGKSFIGPGGAWDYRLDPEALHAYVAWMVNDDPTGIDHMTTVIVKNGTSVPGLAQDVVNKLRGEGYTHVVNGGNAPHPTVQLTASTAQTGLPQTVIIDSGVPDRNITTTLAQDLGVTATVSRQPVKPNHLGWTPPPVVTISLGQDYATVQKDGAPPITTDGTTAN
jgi:LCP family protein required for cell wall assembly